MNRLTALLLLTLAACASSPDPKDYRTEAVPDEAARQKALSEAEAKRRDFQSVLIRLDQAMESYAQAIANAGVPRADSTAEQLERMIRQTVLDESYQSSGEVGIDTPTTNVLRRLEATALDGTAPYQQGIALAALGFTGSPELLDTIVQGAMLDDPFLIDRAVLGLAMLRAPATPPGVLAAIIDNEKLPEATRTQAAWALFRIQDISRRPDEIIAIWRRYAGPDRDKVPTGALVQAVRGLGMARDTTLAELVAPYLHHQYALVRMAAIDAISRMNAQQYATDLIELLTPAETSANVRLHARKALQALAGYLDYGYDVEAWRKAFERK